MRAALLLLLLLTATAHGEPWFRGRYGTNRMLHLSITSVGLAIYPLTARFETVDCRWCGGPNEIDRAVRSGLVWDEPNRGRAASFSNLTAYVGAPVVGIGLVLSGTATAPSIAAVLDDVVPIVESFMVTAYVTRATKIAFARKRPYAHFTGDRDPNEDNVSFPSGHTSYSFAFATSAAMIARARGYKSERYIWIAGMALAATSGYLRIAADRHYLTDVLGGTTLGVAAGLTVPLLMRRELEVVPTSTGIAVAGAW